jgi:site-specific recombinase XerC
MLPAKNGQRTLRLSDPTTQLRREAHAFLVDRQARGLSPRTVSYYADKLAPLLDYLEAAGVKRVQDTTPDLLRRFPALPR